MKKSSLEHRIVELENIVALCSSAFEGIPINMLDNEVSWFPSKDQILKMRRAKDSLRSYTQSYTCNRDC